MERIGDESSIVLPTVVGGIKEFIWPINEAIQKEEEFDLKWSENNGWT